MIKETKKLVEKTIKKTFCDVCGDICNWSMHCERAICVTCGKDLCEKCIDEEINSGGDYRIVYCKSCNDVWKKYQSEIDELEKKQEKIREIAYREAIIKSRYSMVTPENTERFNLIKKLLLQISKEKAIANSLWTLTTGDVFIKLKDEEKVFIKEGYYDVDTVDEFIKILNK